MAHRRYRQLVAPAEHPRRIPIERRPLADVRARVEAGTRLYFRFSEALGYVTAAGYLFLLAAFALGLPGTDELEPAGDGDEPEPASDDAIGDAA